MPFSFIQISQTSKCNFNCYKLSDCSNCIVISTPPGYKKQVITWKISDTISINSIKPVVLESPKIVRDLKGKSLMFDGTDDRLIMSVNPLEGLKSFTVELLFKPFVSDSVAPRMLYIQDNEGNRCTIELRITK